MPSFDHRRADSDVRRTSATLPEFGEFEGGDADIVTDFAVIRATVRRLADRPDPAELAEAVEPMEE